MYRSRFFSMSTAFMLLFAVVGVVDTEYADKMENAVATVGSWVTFHCVGENLGWDKYISGEENPLSISVNQNVTNADKYEVEYSSLSFIVTTLQDAGRYRCKYVPLPTLYRDAELVVLESEPNCTSNATNQYLAIEGDYIKYSCEVTYAGNWAPVITWRVRGKNVTHARDEWNGTVKTSTVIQLRHSEEAYYISCDIEFEQPKGGTSSSNAATNVPLHRRWFRKPAETLCYGPRDVAVTPEHKVYKPGTTIQVTADSVPTLGSYKWMNTTTNTSVGTGNSITITANMVGRASLKVVLCNTMPIPPVYDVCCEVTLSFEVGSDVNDAANTGSPITSTTCPTTPTITTTTSTTRTTQRTTSVSPNADIARPTTNYGGYANNRTFLIVGGAILLCVTLLAVLIVVTTIVLCVRMRRLMNRFND